MSDLVGNPEDRFSHNEAHIVFDIVFVLFMFSCFWNWGCRYENSLLNIKYNGVCMMKYPSSLRDIHCN